MEQTTNKPRRVLIGTPCYDGKIEVWHAHSLVETIKRAMIKGIEVIPIWLSYDALIQRARNDLMSIVLDMQCDDIVFIDADIEWNPDDFFKLLDYPVDVVGGTYPKKGDAEMYVAKIMDQNRQFDPVTGLLEVEGLGTGFLRMSRKAVQWLWDNSDPYEEKEYNKVRRNIFNVIVRDNALISEDIWVCQRLKAAGFPIWLDTKITCNHVGMKKYTGNFDAWFTRLKSSSSTPMAAPAKLNIPQQNSYGNNSLNRFMNPTQVRSLYK